MRFDRESWRKLYVAESAEHKLLPLAARGLRDYLLRFATDDGTLLPKSKDPVSDLTRVIGALPTERKMIASALTELQAIGYLKLDRNGRLWICKFEEAQAARSPGAKRQAEYLARKKKSGGGEGGDGGQTSPDDVSEASPSDVTADVTSSVTSDVTKEETRRDETTTTPSGVVAVAAVVDLPIPCPADLSLTESQIGTLLGAMVPAEAIPWLTKRFVANYQADPDDKRTLVVWRKCLSKAISSGWNDGRTKQEYLRSRESKAAGADDTGGYGSSESWG